MDGFIAPDAGAERMFIGAGAGAVFVRNSPPDGFSIRGRITGPLALFSAVVGFPYMRPIVSFPLFMPILKIGDIPIFILAIFKMAFA
tara:strand:+ start:218 stop:478 length:261 start_codon:yes stop_codon:yes gene_type:complete